MSQTSVNSWPQTPGPQCVSHLHIFLPTAFQGETTKEKLYIAWDAGRRREQAGATSPPPPASLLTPTIFHAWGGPGLLLGHPRLVCLFLPSPSRLQPSLQSLQTPQTHPGVPPSRVLVEVGHTSHQACHAPTLFVRLFPTGLYPQADGTFAHSQEPRTMPTSRELT